MGSRRGIAVVAAALGLLAAPAAAQAQYPAGPFATWDGSNPFKCTVQDVGTGVAFPDPGADPFCVEFDKTQQNITDFGIFEFLANEPARTAAAANKCFYFQTDHWTGSVVQGEGPELWHWDGQYFFDKARAVGGVNVQNFRVFGQAASPADYGEVPPEYAPYFDQGGGGSYLIGEIPADPNCVARVDTPEEAAQVYGAAGPPPLPGAVDLPRPTTGASQPNGTTATLRGKQKCKRKRNRGHRRSRRCARRRH